MNSVLYLLVAVALIDTLVLFSEFLLAGVNGFSVTPGSIFGVKFPRGESIFRKRRGRPSLRSHKRLAIALGVFGESKSANWRIRLLEIGLPAGLPEGLDSESG